MSAADKTVHLHAARRVRALGIPSGTLGPEVVRLIEDGMLLRVLASDPLAKSYTRERLARLLERGNLCETA